MGSAVVSDIGPCPVTHSRSLPPGWAERARKGKLGARRSAIASREAVEGVYAVTSQISYCERREKEESRTNQRSLTKKKIAKYTHS